MGQQCEYVSCHDQCTYNTRYHPPENICAVQGELKTESCFQIIFLLVKVSDLCPPTVLFDTQKCGLQINAKCSWRCDIDWISLTSFNWVVPPPSASCCGGSPSSPLSPSQSPPPPLPPLSQSQPLPPPSPPLLPPQSPPPPSHPLGHQDRVHQRHCGSFLACK